MTTAAHAEAPSASTDAATIRLLPASTEALGEQIVALAARLHAGTYELLVLLREFDDRIVWNNGFAIPVRQCNQCAQDAKPLFHTIRSSNSRSSTSSS